MPTAHQTYAETGAAGIRRWTCEVGGAVRMLLCEAPVRGLSSQARGLAEGLQQPGRCYGTERLDQACADVHSFGVTSYTNRSLLDGEANRLELAAYRSTLGKQAAHMLSSGAIGV